MYVFIKGDGSGEHPDLDLPPTLNLHHRCSDPPPRPLAIPWMSPVGVAVALRVLVLPLAFPVMVVGESLLSLSFLCSFIFYLNFFLMAGFFNFSDHTILAGKF